ncbi:MAG TPA: D-TA family PLP-dependent enzyme [Candidatus Binatia bacterium]|nr:D-TA family PLP-dependent enzyme [Candidatus Binatia bacterium]
MDRWFEVGNVAEVDSPALLIYPDRVEENIRRMIAMVGGGRERLRPHIKTHKMPEIVRLQLAHGLKKCKCATIAEAEMAAQCGVEDILIAYQPVGPKVKRIARLIETFPSTRFSVVADDEEVLRSLPSNFDVLLDIDMGQHRTGVAPGAAARLYRLRSGGLHIYDGHLNLPDATERKEAWANAFAPVRTLIKELAPVPRIVAGGTPTFAFWARETEFECSPGTAFLWDHSYGSKLRDLEFLPAALVLTRVVSKPSGNRLCLDLGHKAIAAESPHPRVHLLDLPEAIAVGHSEEHLVVETPRSEEFRVGDCLYGVPSHICPTVALHASAIVVKNGAACGTWKVAARDRILSI